MELGNLIRVFISGELNELGEVLCTVIIPNKCIIKFKDNTYRMKDIYTVSNWYA